MAILVFKADTGSEDDIAKLLTANGFGSVETYTDSAAFLDALGVKPDGRFSAYRAPADLFILDGITQLKDFEVIGSIRRNFHYQDVPIIVTSYSKEPEFVQMMFAFGANDYVVRPFQQVELIARVRACLKLKHEIDRRQARERELTEVSKQLAELNAWLAKLSLLDGLTRVSNRRAFDETLVQEWKRSVRNKSPIGLLMIDLDYFKAYNDAFGHQSGDECLKIMASAIKVTLNRPADFIGRYGGDEFVVLLPDTNAVGTRIVAERIQKFIESRHVPHAQTAPIPYVTVTIGGTSWYPGVHDQMADFVSCADSGLYKAKSVGRNCVSVVEAPESFPDRLKKTG